MEGWRWTGGHEAVVRLLVELGTDVDAKDKDGGTALHWAENYVCPDLERKRVAALSADNLLLLSLSHRRPLPVDAC